MANYKVEYEQLYYAMIEHDMPLPDNIQAFKLFDRTNLSKVERKLTLTLANEIKFDTMKSALKRSFTVNRDNNKMS